MSHSAAESASATPAPTLPPVGAVGSDRRWSPFLRGPAGPLLFDWRGATRFTPLALAGGIFVFSYLWFAIGPYDWKVTNPWQLYGFLIACTLLLVGGYLFTVLRRGRTPAGVPVVDPNKALTVCAVIFLLLYLPTCRATTGDWYPDIYTGLTDAASAYHTSKDIQRAGGSLWLYVRIVLGPFLISVVPLTLFFWTRLSRRSRWLGAICIALTVALYIAQGINKGMAELAGYTCLYCALLIVSSLKPLRSRRVVAGVLGIALSLGVFGGYYAINVRSRMAADIRAEHSKSKDPRKSKEVSEEEVAKRMRATLTGNIAERRPSNILFYLPGKLQDQSIMLSQYITHGYKGLSFAMEEDFTPMWGLGFSDFVRHNALRVAGEQDREKEIFAHTYAGKITDHRAWVVGDIWATFFIHPASDVGFPGVLVLALLTGLLFGASWRDTVTRGDPLAAVVFFYLCMAVFYWCANNQLYQGGESAIGFTVVLACWLGLRWWGRRRIRRQERVARPAGRG